TMELRADGQLGAIRETLDRIIGQGWMMTTSSLIVRPNSSQRLPISLEMQFVLYGIAEREGAGDGMVATGNPIDQTR
ncbi:MAG: hypothetical protein AAF517_27690, partial [Planctomycetota bacterium]